MQEHNIYRDVLAYLNGSIYETNRTSSSIYLSNGLHYKLHLFNQHRLMAEMIIREDLKSDEVILMYKKTKEEQIRNIKLEKEAKIKELNSIINEINKTLNDKITLMKHANFRLTFGKHKGKLSSEIDDEYLLWLSDLPNFVGFDKEFIDINLTKPTSVAKIIEFLPEQDLPF